MVQKYKNNELSDAEMAQIEEDLMAQMFRRQKEDSLRADLKKLATLASNEEKSEETTIQNTRMTVVHRSNSQRIWWAAAASVAVIAIAGWWLFLKPQPTENLSAVALADTYIKGDAAPKWLTTMDNTAGRRLKPHCARTRGSVMRASPSSSSATSAWRGRSRCSPT